MEAVIKFIQEHHLIILKANDIMEATIFPARKLN